MNTLFHVAYQSFFLVAAVAVLDAGRKHWRSYLRKRQGVFVLHIETKDKAYADRIVRALQASGIEP